MKTFKTAKGTELPLANLKGKDYLQVCHRLVWFREEHPDWSIETELLVCNAQEALAKATIRDATGRVIATGHKTETSKDFPAGWAEKGETGAIGRALALCGYGTQFAPELDEEERIVDAPIERTKASPVLKASAIEGSLAALVATVKTRGVVEETKLYMRKNFGFEESARLNGPQITQILGALTSGEIKKLTPRDQAWVSEPFDMNAGDTRI